MKAPILGKVTLTDDLELRKQIAEQAQLDAATAATPAVRAFQFFLVPLLIVGACVLVYVLFSAVVINPRSPQDLLTDIKEGGPNTRPHAALKLVEYLRRSTQPDTSITPDIIALYRSTPPDAPGKNSWMPGASSHQLRICLLNCLGVLRDARASDLLLEVVTKDENLELRTAGLDAIGAVKDPATLAALVKLLDDPNPVVRKYAAFNAGAVAEKSGAEASPAATEGLRRRLKDEKPDVGWNAAFALAWFLGDASGTDTLKKMLDRKYLGETIGNDPNADVLVARAMFTACNAAVKLKDPSFLPLLEGITDPARERDVDVRYAAHEAIARIKAR